MKKILILASAVLLAFGAKAQLRSSGKVPADMKMTVQQLYDADMERAKQYAGGRVKNKEQVMESSYRINKMMAGGHIIYGDPISNMVSRIADTLLKDYPTLRSELRFYTVTSPEVNAFTTGQGMVFVNVGLVAQVEDEAQLAFILSHEIIHYYRSHSIEEIVGKNKNRTAEVEEGDNEMSDFMRRHHRSREMENEADSLGIAMFYMNSPYSREVIDGVFDVLQYSELPFDEIPFDTTWFNTPYFKLTGCWLDTTANITSRDNYDDSRSSHPNIVSRRRNCAAALDGYYGGERYVITTKAEFEALRDMARKECIRQEVVHGQYARAFYNTWLMLKANPNDETLNKYMAQELYGIAMFKNHEDENKAVGNYKEIEGESQQVYYAMKKMSAEQATLIALHKAWELHRRFTADNAYERIATDLMDELRSSNKKSVIDFVLEAPKEEVKDQPADSTAAAPTDNDRPKTKYERIKQKRETQTKRNPTAYAITDIAATDPEFTSALRNHLNGSATKPADVKDSANGIMIFDPTYWVANKNGEMKYSESDSRESDLTSRLLRMGKHFGCESVNLSDGGLHMMESDTQYNDFLTLCEWMNEFWLDKGEYTMQRIMQPAMDEMLDRYNAKTINITVVLNIEGTDPDIPWGYAFILPIAPIVIPASLSGLEHTNMASVIVDARNGKVLARESYSYNVADHSDFVDAMIYDTYAHALRSKKKEPTGLFGHHVALAGGFNLGFAGYQTFDAGHYFALTPWASLEVALKRDFSLVASFRYHKGYEDVTRTEYTDVFDNNGWWVRTDETLIQCSKNMFIVGLNGRKYKQSDFAPLGKYFSFGIHWVHFTELAGDNGGNTFGINIGMGRNYTFFHRLLLNWQVDYAYTYGLSRTIDFDFSDTYKKYLHYADAIMSNILTFKLGIGFIPF
ncbi:MAG: M48 family metallopeptidase [Bacteroidales bacterium]|nr:M48 family metallopeptidase [Bacteroidales bacterium]